MIDGGWPVVALEEAEPGIPDIGLQRPGSVALTLQSVMVPGGQVPPALAALPPPALLAAPGPVAWPPGSAVGAGLGEVMPVVAEGLLMPGAAVEFGLELGLGLEIPPVVLPPVLPDVPLEDVWAMAGADKLNSEAATRGRILMVVMAGSRIGNDAD